MCHRSGYRFFEHIGYCQHIGWYHQCESALSNSVLLHALISIKFQFFDFHSTKLEHSLILPSAVVSILLHRDSGLLAAGCDDMVVRVVDIETRRIVREMVGFRGRVLDIVCS